MFRGKEKPLALSQRKGCSNKLNKTVMKVTLAMQVTKNTKALKPRAKVGKRNYICKGYCEFVTSVR